MARITLHLLALLTLAALALALRSQAPLVSPAHHISLPLFDSLEELSRLVDIAYCVGTASPGIHPPFLCASRCQDFPNFTLITTWNTGPLLSDSCGYLAISPPTSASPTGRILLAFRGTYSLTNTIVDLSSTPQPYTPYPTTNSTSPDQRSCQNCTVHTGFLASWTNTRPLLLPHIMQLRDELPGYELELVGHSLGGAVAALAALELEERGVRVARVTTFGEPRVGNDRLADYIDAVFDPGGEGGKYRRVTHVGDPVPLLPPGGGYDNDEDEEGSAKWGYASHGSEIFIDKGPLPADISDVRRCEGGTDPECSAGKAGQSWWWWGRGRGKAKAGFLPWVPLPLFAHRDYFHRLGLCVPGGDPGGEWD